MQISVKTLLTQLYLGSRSMPHEKQHGNIKDIFKEGEPSVRGGGCEHVLATRWQSRVIDAVKQ